MSGISKQAMNSLARLHAAGISADDASTLRRCAMTLQRWFEQECGDSNNYGSWAIVRGHKPNGTFTHDDDGRPYLEHHHYMHGRGKDTVTYSPLADREAGARKRIAAILKRYPGFAAYVQTDPRGAALYILRPGDIRPDQDVSCCYTNGVALFK